MSIILLFISGFILLIFCYNPLPTSLYTILFSVYINSDVYIHIFKIQIALYFLCSLRGPRKLNF